MYAKGMFPVSTETVEIIQCFGAQIIFPVVWPLSLGPN